MNEREHVELFIGGAPLDVVSLTGEEAVSRLFRFDLVCRAGEGFASAPGLVAAEARVVLWDGHGAERAIRGLVTAAAERISDDGTVELAVTVRPHAYVLALGRACRVYQNKTVVEIVKEVIARSAQKTKWELVSSYKPHEYCAEYREDDLTFMTRMLEEEGIHFRFDHDGGATTLVFDDSSTIGPDLPGGADIEFSYQRGMRAAPQGLPRNLRNSPFMAGSQTLRLHLYGSVATGATPSPWGASLKKLRLEVPVSRCTASCGRERACGDFRFAIV